MTKGSDHQVFIADSTRRRLSDAADDLIELGEAEVRGRSGKIELWTIREAPRPAGAGTASSDASELTEASS